MKVKVCGMRDPENIRALGDSRPDLTGLIFYERSPRYVAGIVESKTLLNEGADQTFVGVFVNEDLEAITKTLKEFNLEWVQLHGDESPDYCRSLTKAGYKVVKAIPVRETSDLEVCRMYRDSVELFLFDTKTPKRGGSGQKFDWSVLDNYTLSTPFLLSGGIGPDDLGAVMSVKHKAFYGIDLNSGFEIEPALKDIDLVTDFINHVRMDLS